MKRAIFVLVSIFAILLFTTGCNRQQTVQAPVDAGNEASLQIVTTIFPQYDFVRQIAEDRVELTMLLSPGAESHGFEPTPRDIIAINSADLLVYVGGHGDIWVERILASLDTEIRTVALMDLVEPLEEEIVEGMEHGHHHHEHSHSHDHHHSHDHEDCDDGEHEHSHSHDHHHSHEHDNDDCDDDHHHEHHYDEHVWTSPENAILIVEALTDILAELDPANAEFFRSNAAAYIAELEELDRAFAEVVATGVRTTLIFGDRFPMRYFTDAYGLTYFAAFTGCSAETQASPATIAFLIEKVRTEDIPVVLHVELSNRLIANVIVEATGARLLEMHSLHNVSPADYAAGVTYLELMRRNMETLREALN